MSHIRAKIQEDVILHNMDIFVPIVQHNMFNQKTLDGNFIGAKIFPSKVLL